MASPSPSVSPSLHSPLLVRRQSWGMDVEEGITGAVTPSATSTPLSGEREETYNHSLGGVGPGCDTSTVILPVPQPPTVCVPVDEDCAVANGDPGADRLAEPLLHPQVRLLSPRRVRPVYEHIRYWSQLLRDHSRWDLVLAVAAWFLVGLGAIVTTKLLLTEWGVPPLLLTFQQFLLAGHLLKMRLLMSSGGIAPWPWRAGKQTCAPGTIASGISGSPCSSPLASGGGGGGILAQGHLDCVMAGLFNALDLLASNAAFAASAAAFVETIKSSDPITTTAVALVWGVDRLERDEGTGLFLLVAGMLLSTWGNAAPGTGVAGADAAAVAVTLAESTQSAATVLLANVCFAFRAMSQKLYRRHAAEQMSDENLLAKMFQTGWMALSVPCLVSHGHLMYDAIVETPGDVQVQYLKLAGGNAVAFAIYNLASTYVLSKMTVLHHSTLGCLRRMFVVIGTCLFFGSPMTVIGAVGLVTSFAGFCGFTFYRSQRHRREEKSDV